MEDKTCIKDSVCLLAHILHKKLMIGGVPCLIVNIIICHLSQVILVYKVIKKCMHIALYIEVFWKWGCDSKQGLIGKKIVVVYENWMWSVTQQVVSGYSSNNVSLHC